MDTNTVYSLNTAARKLVDDQLPALFRLGVQRTLVPGGGQLLDCGILARGGIGAGIFLARLTVSDLAVIEVCPGDVDGRPCPSVVVRTDHPVAACMASQYAGWQIAVGKFFAMGSGPFRAVYGKEEIFDRIGCRERATHALGALETRSLPGPEVFAHIASKLGIDPASLTLAVAPTASIAGSLQVVARSVETALHKLDVLGFDLGRVVSGFGSAPLPPPARNDLESIARTNDSILYGSRVSLFVRGDDASLAEIGQRTPACSSRDWGAPFLETFRRYDNDFYKIDPQLFSPAEIAFHNVESGRSHFFGSRKLDLLRASFFGT